MKAVVGNGGRGLEEEVVQKYTFLSKGASPHAFNPCTNSDQERVGLLMPDPLVRRQHEGPRLTLSPS